MLVFSTNYEPTFTRLGTLVNLTFLSGQYELWNLLSGYLLIVISPGKLPMASSVSLLVIVVSLIPSGAVACSGDGTRLEILLMFILIMPLSGGAERRLYIVAQLFQSRSPWENARTGLWGVHQCAYIQRFSEASQSNF